MIYRVLLAILVAWISGYANAGTVVVLGDSISAAYGMELEQGWVSLLQARLNIETTGTTIVNESIGGETTSGGLARLNRILVEHKPEILLIELGANDGLRGLSLTEMKNNIAEMIRRAKNTGAKPVLMSMRIPPNYGKRYTDMFYNVYQQLSLEFKIPFVPFILEDIALIQELMQADGLHPNTKAQPMIADKVWQQLQPLIK